MTMASRFSYDAGASGTVTVPAGKKVVGIACHASGAGSFTIAPTGPNDAAAVTGASIPLPAGTSFSIGRPVLDGDQNEVGPGSVIIFTGTDSYFVAYENYIVSGFGGGA
jgi:hypothetical protein